MDCSQRVQAVTDYFCPVSVCNEQGVKERKNVSVQANKDKATDERNPKKTRNSNERVTGIF